MGKGSITSRPSTMLLSARRVLPILRALCALALVVGMLRVTMFTVYRVSGTSMEDALDDGDRILVCDVPWMLPPPELGDTVIAEVDGEVLVKRVVAGPGDSIAILFGTIVRNGEIVEEQIAPRRRLVETLGEHTLGRDEYFLLGDHRKVSVDSRDFGPVTLAQIRGYVMLRMGLAGVTSVEALQRG
jgi:signal peptidase I